MVHRGGKMNAVFLDNINVSHPYMYVDVESFGKLVRNRIERYYSWTIE